MIKKGLLLLLVVFMARFIFSCACHCTDSHQCQYTFQSLKTVNVDNSGIKPIITDTDTIPKESYGMELQMTLVQVGTCQLNLPSLFTEAKAKDCVCPPPVQYTTKDTLSTLTITTINDFDGQHPAATDVSTYFKVYVPNGGVISIADFLKQKPITMTDISLGENILLFLLTPPSVSSRQSFKVDIVLSDQRTMTFTTKSVYFK